MLAYLSEAQILHFYGLHREAFALSGIYIDPPKSRVTALDPRSITTTILYRSLNAYDRLAISKKLGLALIFLTIGAFVSAYSLTLRMAVNEIAYTTYVSMVNSFNDVKAKFGLSEAAIAQPAAPEFDPLIDPVGNKIIPVDTEFSIVVPKIGINAPVVAGVNPASKPGYLKALKDGVAHSSTSFYPNEHGTVYLFSHSTNYEWFVKDLNAVFFRIKSLEEGDYVVVMYLGSRYTYKIREKKIVSPKEISYLNPQPGSRNLILQTCWPPGSVSKRLLIFGDLIDVKTILHFDDVVYLKQ